MPASPAMRFSPGREARARADHHKRGRSLENGVVFKERDDDDDDDDLALFNEVQSRERDNFLLQSNDDFDDTFGTKLRGFSDHKLGINIGGRGESSDFLNTEEEKNDYEWLITPPDTPLFPSLDDEVIVPQRGRPRAQPISISRSSTMEKSRRGSPSPNRLSPSPRSSVSTTTTFQTAAATGSRRPSSPSTKPCSKTPPRASTPTSRRLSTGSSTRGIAGVKTTRGNSASPKIRAWQSNSIPGFGFSTEAPPNLRTCLADRPASYVRGSSPASRNSRQSMSPTPSRSISISPSHSHDRDRFNSPRSKGSSVDDDDVDFESLPSVIVDDGSERSNSRKVSGFRNNNNNNNKASFSNQKPTRTVSSNSAPKRSFDLALRQMDHQKRVAQNMFRPLLSSVPSSTFYAGKPTPAWNSSVTTSSNASSDVATSYAHEIEEVEDDATSGCVKLPDSTTVDADDQVFIFQKTNSLNEDTGNEAREISSTLQFGDFKDGFENLADCDTAATSSVVSDDFKDVEVETLKDTLHCCSKCGCRYSDIRPTTQDDIKLCENCQKSSTAEVEDDESFNTMKPQMNPVEVTQFEQHQDLLKDGVSTHGEPIESQLEEEEPSYSDARSDQIQIGHAVDFSNLKVDSLAFKKSKSIKEEVVRSGNFSASSISYDDDLSYVRGSTNSMRSSLGRGSLSASSSFDFGPITDARFQLQRQLSNNKKSEISENYKHHHHRRSLSSFSATSSHAFHRSSVGTSTLDSFEVSGVRGVGKDVADVASIGPQCENDTWTENEEDMDNVEVEIGSNSELPTFNQTGHESTNFEDLGKDDSEEEDTSSNVCVEQVEVEVEVELSVISEGENDQTCSPDSQCNLSQDSEINIEELHVGDTSHQSSSINEESLVLIEGEGKTKGRSLTLEEATDTILFCSSIVHNLAYEAATLSIQKQALTPPPPHPDPSEKLIPAHHLGKARKEVQTKQKTRQRKATTKPPPTNNDNNTADTNEETDLAKPRIVYPNNKENRRPPKLESKCHCSIM